MFEALEPYQPGMAAQLKQQIQEGTLSQVNLFGGNRYSLRMSFALEVARVLSCHEDGRAECNCESCRKFKTLSVSNVIIISQRDHRSVVETALSTFERMYNEFSRTFLILSIKRLLLQYHPALLEGSVTQSQNSAANTASNVNDILMDVMKAQDLDAKSAKKLATELRASLKGLWSAAKKNSTVTIGQVRALDQWVNQTSMGGEKRFIILEAMEQTNSSARNSLLKMLEEPAKDSYFFLLSEYPNRIMQTILSRVRRYNFPSLSEEAVGMYLQPFYMHDKQYTDLQSFFLEGGGMDLSAISRYAETIGKSVEQKRYLSTSELTDLLSQIDQMQGYEYLLTSLLDYFSKTTTSRRLQKIAMLINSSYNTGLLYNQNSRLMLEALYYRMMEET